MGGEEGNAFTFSPFLESPWLIYHPLMLLLRKNVFVVIWWQDKSFRDEGFLGKPKEFDSLESQEMPDHYTFLGNCPRTPPVSQH